MQFLQYTRLIMTKTRIVVGTNRAILEVSYAQNGSSTAALMVRQTNKQQSVRKRGSLSTKKRNKAINYKLLSIYE